MMRALSKETPLASTRMVVPRTENTWMPNQLKNHARDRQVVCRRSSGVKTSFTPVAWWAASSRPCSSASAWAPAVSPAARRRRTSFIAAKVGDSGRRRARPTTIRDSTAATTKLQRQPMSGSVRADSPAETSAPTGQPPWTSEYMRPRLLASL